MHALPITLGLFCSTKGHFGRKDDWRITLDHWDKQVPLSLFNCIAHIKVGETEADAALAAKMAAELRARGFTVLQTVGNWTRGLSHGAAYLGDMATMSRESAVYHRPYFLLLEDDSPVVVHKGTLEALLLRSCQILEDHHDAVTVRTIRKGDYDGGVPTLGDAQDGRAFYSPNTDFQPLIMRSIDFMRLCMILEANPEACAKVHCEQLWARILFVFSRNPLKHVVWKPEVAETVHIGVENQQVELAKL